MHSGTAPGSLIDVGGYRLHLDCAGEGAPPVVFEAAMSDISLTWSLVQADVAAFARACAYDRGGLGWSEPSPNPRTGAVMVEELRAVLQGAGIPPPYVLVAHSSSGILARMFAHRHPDEVSGMVLVDSAHEEQSLRFPEPIRMAQGPIWEQARAAVTGLRGLIETGSLDPAAIPAPPQLRADVADRYRALMGTRTAVDTMLAELATIEQIHAEARDSEISTLGDIPLVVICHGEPTPPFPPELGVSDEDMRRYEEVWQELQSELAAMSSRGRLLVAGGAGHLIHHERPDLVVDAVRKVVTAVRG